MAIPPEATRDLVQRALEGDKGASRALVGVLAPVVQFRVARVLRCRRSMSRDIREEVLDLTQDVYLHLFKAGGRALRQWDPECGLSLRNYVGLIAERKASAIFRSQALWREEAVDPASLEDVNDIQDLEQMFVSKELAGRVLDAATALMTDMGRYVFDLVFVQGLSVEDVCARADMTADAVYAWRSRLGRLVEKVAREMAADTTPGGSHEP
jgi:RNA polymerase sigma-70 factor (ECF subfamily)